MTDNKRKPGRPALPPSEKLMVVHLRLNAAQRETLRAVGVQRLREWLDSLVRRPD